MSTEAARARAEAIAREHDENFPVAFLLAPRDVRADMRAIYAYCRVTDDIGDAGEATPEQRLQALDAWEQALGQAVQGVVDSGKVSDTKAMDMVNGKGDMVDVVTAISSAEASLETVISIRDQVISAYQEIMRMSI